MNNAQLTCVVDNRPLKSFTWITNTDINWRIQFTGYSHHLVANFNKYIKIKDFDECLLASLSLSFLVLYLIQARVSPIDLISRFTHISAHTSPLSGFLVKFRQLELDDEISVTILTHSQSLLVPIIPNVYVHILPFCSWSGILATTVMTVITSNEIESNSELSVKSSRVNIRLVK